MSEEHKRKIPQQNVSKKNSIVYKENYNHNKTELIQISKNDWTHKPINVIYHFNRLKKKKEKYVIISIDAAKPFGKKSSIHWPNKQKFLINQE